MADSISITLRPEIHLLYPPPDEYENIWGSGLIQDHQYLALITSQDKGRIHAPTGAGKSRAAAFFAVSPFHRGTAGKISAIFAFPTNLLTKHQFEKGLIEGLIENLSYKYKGESKWTFEDEGGEIVYQKLETPEGEELRVAKLTGSDVARLLIDIEDNAGKADLLLKFLQWLNQSHHFLIVSPDLLAYSVNEVYGSRSVKYRKTRKRSLHNMLREHTLIIDEYHQYDPFTLINFENLLSDEKLKPRRILLLSATKREDFFPDIPTLTSTLKDNKLPKAIGERTASRKIEIRFHREDMEEINNPETGLTLYIHNSLITNRRKASHLRSQGIPLIQWDGTRKDEYAKGFENDVHLILGTSAVEIGLDLSVDRVVTEWWPSINRTDQITQRIGRAGRGPDGDPAVVDIYVPGALDSLWENLKKNHNMTMTKDELNELLHRISMKNVLNREEYISYYYPEEKQGDLVIKGYLQLGEKLKYSFRPPGNQALFLDKEGEKYHIFIYDKAPIISRYDFRYPIPEEMNLIDKGWKKLCDGLNISEEDYFVIMGEKEKRDWFVTLTGELSELNGPKQRRWYIERAWKGNDSPFI